VRISTTCRNLVPAPYLIMKDFAVAMNGSFIFVYDMLGLILF